MASLKYMRFFCLSLPNWANKPNIIPYRCDLFFNRPLSLHIDRPKSRSRSRSNPNANIQSSSSRSIHWTHKVKHPTKILYDGDCRICQVEISLLKKYTKNKDDLLYVNISGQDYDPSLNGGVSYEDAMKEMHVIGRDGKVYVKGDAIRQMYRACGLGWLAALTELPAMRPVCDYLYVVFAKYRLREALKRCDKGSCSVKLKQLRDEVEQSKK